MPVKAKAKTKAKAAAAAAAAVALLTTGDVAHEAPEVLRLGRAGESVLESLQRNLGGADPTVEPLGTGKVRIALSGGGGKGCR